MRSAEMACRRIHLDELTQSGAVHIGDVAHVQQQLAVALLQQALNLVLQDDVSTFAQGDVAADGDDGDIACHSLINLHSSSLNSVA
jgi:hypothetical protein